MIVPFDYFINSIVNSNYLNEAFTETMPTVNEIPASCVYSNVSHFCSFSLVCFVEQTEDPQACDINFIRDFFPLFSLSPFVSIPKVCGESSIDLCIYYC